MRASSSPLFAEEGARVGTPAANAKVFVADEKIYGDVVYLGGEGGIYNRGLFITDIHIHAETILP